MPLRVNVFVSSTQRDLKVYRTPVRDALMSLGAFPIMMENFNASSDNALQVCYDKVQEADLFVGIYAHRYGYVPDETVTYMDKGNVRSSDGKTGITHWEYLWAMERGIPVYLFLLRDVDDEGKPIEWPQEMVGDELDTSRLNEFKALITARHVVGFFYSKEHLARIMLQALAFPIYRWSPGEPVVQEAVSPTAADLALGIDLLSRREYEGALRAFTRYVMFSPADPQGYFYRGQCYETMNDPERALEDLSAAISVQEKRDLVNPIWYARRALLRKRMHHYDSALMDCDRAIEILASRHSLVSSKTRGALAVGDRTAGWRYRQQEHQLSQTLADLFNLRGTTLGEEGKFSLAFQAFDHALTFTSEEPRLYLNRGKARLRAYGPTALSEAVLDFTKAIELMPAERDHERADAYTQRAAALWELKRIDEAEHDVDEALERVPCHTDALVILGDIYRTRAQYKKAIREYGQAIDCNRDNYVAFLKRGDAYMDEWKTARSASLLESAIADFQRAVQLQPTYGWTYNLLGVAYHRTQRFVDAENAYRQGLERTTERRLHLTLHLNLGVTLFEVKRDDEAFLELDAAFALSGARFLLAAALRTICRFALNAPEATAEWREVQASDPAYQTLEPLQADFSECPRLMATARALIVAVQKG